MSGLGSVVVSPISGTWIWSWFSPLTLGKVTDSLVFIGVGAAGWCCGSSHLRGMAWWTKLCSGISPEGLVRLCPHSLEVVRLCTFSGGSKALLATGSINKTLHIFTIFCRLAWRLQVSYSVQIFRWTVLNLATIWPWRVSNISVMFSESSGELCLRWRWCFFLWRQSGEELVDIVLHVLLRARKWPIYVVTWGYL